MLFILELTCINILPVLDDQLFWKTTFNTYYGYLLMLQISDATHDKYPIDEIYEVKYMKIIFKKYIYLKFTISRVIPGIQTK